MNNRAQMQSINALIAHDEKSITALEARLDKFAIRKDAMQPSCYRVRMHAWVGTLLTLKQGLEGLKLKHDALVDSEAILSSTAKDSKDEDARSSAHRQGELIQ